VSPCVPSNSTHWAGITPIVSIACGSFTSFVQISGSEVWATGDNSNGEGGGVCNNTCMFGGFSGNPLPADAAVPRLQANPLYPIGFEPNNMNASVNASNANRVNGGAWSTAPNDQGQGGDQWFEADLGAGGGLSTRTLMYTGIKLGSVSANNYPISYKVYVSTNPNNWTLATSNWGSPVASGVGASQSVTMTFPPQSAEYVRIQETGVSTTNPWDIGQFEVLY
jgi:hypothetical protein